jgi:hypothetical protein
MLKRSLTATLVLLFAATISLAREEESLEQLKARVESASAADQAKICVEVARRQLDAADKLYTDGDADKARAAVEESAVYAEKAGQAAQSSGKHLKKIEIEVRKMSRKLGDLRRAISLEERPPVDAAIERMEKVRTDLLTRMFAKEKKS